MSIGPKNSPTRGERQVERIMKAKINPTNPGKMRMSMKDINILTPKGISVISFL